MFGSVLCFMNVKLHLRGKYQVKFNVFLFKYNIIYNNYKFIKTSTSN